MSPSHTHLTPVHPPAESVTSATDRLVAMLTGPENEPLTLTRAQLAWLMGTAQRWGYEARELEENEEWTALQNRPPVQVLGRWYDQADCRRRADAEARLPRVNDYKGGPVAWDTTTEVAA